MEKSKDGHSAVMRCPRLGDEVPFGYCEREGGDLPCPRVRICWGEVFAVEDYFRKRLGEEAWERFCGKPPQDRLANLIDLASAAKRRREEKA